MPEAAVFVLEPDLILRRVARVAPPLPDGIKMRRRNMDFARTTVRRRVSLTVSTTASCEVTSGHKCSTVRSRDNRGIVAGPVGIVRPFRERGTGPGADMVALIGVRWR